MALLSGLGRFDFPLLALDSLQPGSLSPLRSFGKAEPLPSTGDFVHLEALAFATTVFADRFVITCSWNLQS